MKSIFLFVLLFASFVSAQVEQSRGVNPYTVGPQFYLDLANYPSEKEGRTRVDVFLQVPYANLQFIKKGDGYSASYSVTLTFYDENKENVLFEKVWNEKLNVNDFDKTAAKTGNNLSYRSSDLKPGKYILLCYIEDLDSKKNVAIQSLVNVRAFTDSIDASDIILISKRIKSKSGEQIIPNISKIVSTKEAKISFFYEIYSNAEKDLFIEYALASKSKEGSKTYRQLVPQSVKKGKNIIYYSFDDPKLSLGDYNIIVSIHNEKNKELKRIVKTIHSKIYGFPNVIKDLDLAVSQMMYIASSDELDYIEEADSFDVKLKRFEDFWKARDPSPNTVENEVLYEYYRRVAYSNEHFKSYYDGWKTDMGMIYITLGAPNQVERHPFEYDSKPYEVWDFYDLNKRFIFVDQTGFGDYRLLNPVYGDWYRYRN